jgi:hypothetical protein
MGNKQSGSAKSKSTKAKSVDDKTGHDWIIENGKVHVWVCSVDRNAHKEFVVKLPAKTAVLAGDLVHFINIKLQRKADQRYGGRAVSVLVPTGSKPDADDTDAMNKTYASGEALPMTVGVAKEAPFYFVEERTRERLHFIQLQLLNENVARRSRSV